MTRDELVAELAEVSHLTWMRQKARDQGVADPDASVTDHDRERAEDTVAKLEALGMFKPFAAPRTAVGVHDFKVGDRIVVMAGPERGAGGAITGLSDDGVSMSVKLDLEDPMTRLVEHDQIEKA